jgi:hypothetical protein
LKTILKQNHAAHLNHIRSMVDLDMTMQIAELGRNQNSVGEINVKTGNPTPIWSTPFAFTTSVLFKPSDETAVSASGVAKKAARPTTINLKSINMRKKRFHGNFGWMRLNVWMPFVYPTAFCVCDPHLFLTLA